MEPTVSVAVVVHDDERGLRRLLRSLSRSAPGVSVHVVDNASPRPVSSAELSSQFPALRFVVSRREKNSMCEARQDALLKARGEWLAFLDSDCVVPASWLATSEAHLRSLSRRPRVWAWAGPTLNRGVSWLDRSIRFLSRPFAVHRRTKIERPVSHLPTCAIFFRRERLLEIGGFPPGFDRVGEDVIVSKKIRSHGGDLLLMPTPQVAHHQVQNVWQWLRRMERYGRAQGAVSWRFPSHLFGRRTLPALALGAGVFAAFAWPATAGAAAAVLFAIWLGLGPAFDRRREKIAAGGLVVFGLAMYGFGFFRGLLERNS